MIKTLTRSSQPIRRALWFALGLGLAGGAAASTGCAASADDEPTIEDLFGIDTTGNGAPSGAHYNLNIIGVPRGKTADMTGDNGHRIFVPRTGNTKILLQEGTATGTLKDLQVLDANGTDGSAKFQLPAPDPDGDGVTSYSVFARALGRPGGSSTTTTCATDTSDGSLVCSLDTLVLVRSTGKSTFDNVSRELLSITADIDGDGTVETVPLFSDGLQDFFWQYDNAGLHLAQLRFYAIPSSLSP